MASGQNNHEHKLFACGFNGFGQLPLQDKKLKSLRQVTYPELCMYPPVNGRLSTFLAVGWSQCILKNKGKNICCHGFSSGSSNSMTVWETDDEVEDVHCFGCTCFAIPSSCSGLLIPGHHNRLVDVRIHAEGGKEDLRITRLDREENRILALTDNQGLGTIEMPKEGGSYLYKPLVTGHHVKSFSCGKEHTLILTSQGEVFSMGSGSRGQLGHGTVEDRLHAAAVIESIAAVPMVNISAGGWHSAAVSEYGDLYIWGWNESGQLGFPMVEKHTRHRDTPREVTQTEGGKTSANGETPEASSQVSRGDHQIPEDSNRPVTFLTSPQILDMAPPKEIAIQSVSCGSRHTAAVTRGGHLYTWGYGRWGQLAHGNEWTLDTPKEVEGLGGHIADVYCREWNTFILTREQIT